jgi:hypothetical protein
MSALREWAEFRPKLLVPVPWEFARLKIHCLQGAIFLEIADETLENINSTQESE